MRASTFASAHNRTLDGAVAERRHGRTPLRNERLKGLNCQGMGSCVSPAALPGCAPAPRAPGAATSPPDGATTAGTPSSPSAPLAAPKRPNARPIQTPIPEVSSPVSRARPHRPVPLLLGRDGDTFALLPQRGVMTRPLVRLPVSTGGEFEVCSATGWRVSVGVVGLVVGPGAPEDADPGPGEDADGVRVVAAAPASAGVDVGGPGAGMAGVVREAGQRGPQALVARPAPADAAGLAALVGLNAERRSTCGSACNKDPVRGVIGVQSGPP